MECLETKVMELWSKKKKKKGAVVILVKEYWVVAMAGSYTMVFFETNNSFRSGSNCFQMKPEH